MDDQHDARKLDALGKEDLRRRVVHAVINEGMSISKAARVFGVWRTSVHAWLDLYRKAGEEGRVPKRPGRPKGGGYLKGWQAGVIVNIIKDRTPDQLKLPFALWTREAVRDLIYDKFGVWYAVRSVGDLLDRWGFTAQKPQRRASERDDAQIRRWLSAHAEACELVLLPPHAPELNPDEILNPDLEANVFSSGRSATKRQMIRQARTYLASTQKRPDVVQSFFKETHIAYAAA